ncbi:MAG: peroxide stress protein YaaA [Solirubrobacterales bacterium]|nr:peroxide stress protein YaaA [Solirubrobacterales bacterium]MCB0860543.1 peroxide stress protein YaaA [Solirubrobacterales bacterium]HRV59882.1 peroxide stress protein YaaA [Solirubrobacterales bacterium]
MLILLPPSEGKASPSGKTRLDLGSLAFADQLGGKRAELIAALEKLGKAPQKKAIEVLGISKGQAGEIARDAELATAPAAPASELYTGVLYDRLDFGTLTAAAGRRAKGNLLIASALWGFLAPADRIPYYRFSMKAKLPKIGGLPAYWRDALTAAMESAGHDEEGGLVLDMRSGAYSAAWKPKRARLVTVRGFTETGGKRKAISHMAKAVRGEVARTALSARSMPKDLETLAGLLEKEGKTIELTDKTLDVIEKA